MRALAQAMKDRIQVLNLTAVEIAKRGGPARTSLKDFLNARRTPREPTLEAIDRVLGWPAGLSKGLLDQTHDLPDPHAWLDLPDQNRLGLLRSNLIALRKEHYRLSEKHRHNGDLIGQLLSMLDAERN